MIDVRPKKLVYLCIIYNIMWNVCCVSSEYCISLLHFFYYYCESVFKDIDVDDMMVIMFVTF